MAAREETAPREQAKDGAPSVPSPVQSKAADPAKALSALEQLVLSAIAEPPLHVTPPRGALGRRSLAQTSDGVPLPPVKRSRAGKEAAPEGEHLTLLAAEALRQMGPPPLARPADQAPPHSSSAARRPLAATALVLPSLATLSSLVRRPISRSETSAPSVALTSYTLSIAQQPPARAVYKRIIRPFPAVSLVWGGEAAARPRGLSNLFVEVFLIDEGRPDVVLPYLEGTRIARVTDRSNAIFTKLKIQCTSQMLKGCVCRFCNPSTAHTRRRESLNGRIALCFTLKEFTGNAFQTISSVRVTSSAMEIFSHTQYLTDSTDAHSDSGAKRVPSPQCSEILPASGRATGGTRCVILGEGFESGAKLSAQFGNSEPVAAHFHESGTILVTTPPRSRGMVPVRLVATFFRILSVALCRPVCTLMAYIGECM